MMRFKFWERNESKERENGKPLCFSFGDPERVLTTSLTDYYGVFLTNDSVAEYYEPPLPLKGLSKIRTANAHHGSALIFKRNMLTKWYEPSRLLPLAEFRKVAYEWHLYGQAYLKVVFNRLGHVIGLKSVPGINMRRLKEIGRYAYLSPRSHELTKYRAGEIIHIKEYDPLQEIYGIPDYLAALQSMLLNEDATLFRRRYYQNGAHVGYVFFVADGRFDTDDEEILKRTIQESKGAGNFRSMYLNIPNAKPDSVKIIPVGDSPTKDEFERVKNITRDDVLGVHRIHRELAGVIPTGQSYSGDIMKISQINYENEVVPMQQAMLEINDYFPNKKPINFKEPSFN